MRFHHLATAAIAVAVATSPSAAQAPSDSVPARDVASFTAGVQRARAALAADRGRLWRARLDTVRWMGVENGRVWLTADPRAAGYVRDGSMWTGTLPAGISPSNTSVTWSGHRWAMVMLQHLGDSTEAARLLVHEAMHTLQPALLPTPTYSETGAGSGLLDEADGRTLLRLEWRALAAALRARAGVERMGGRARLDAIHDALVFRAARYALASPDEIVRERALDVAEGLPEYTAWRITRSPRRDFIAALDSAPARLPSFVRAFVYYTGPAYAFLLDDYEDGVWRRSVRSLPDLQRLLLVAWRNRARTDGITAVMNDAFAGRTLTSGDRARLTSLAHELAARYDGVAITREEEARWAARERQLAEYRAKFVAGPTLRLRPRSLSISFDPRGQASLGDAGTVMANLVWRGPDGAELHAPGGALVTPTWKEVRVPRGDVQLTPGPLAAPLSLHGDGWTLELPAGWVVSAEGDSFVLSPPGK
jgi:hypothetical protein